MHLENCRTGKAIPLLTPRLLEMSGLAIHTRLSLRRWLVETRESDKAVPHSTLQ